MTGPPAGQSNRRLSLRDLTRGKLGQDREDELRLRSSRRGILCALISH